MDEPLHAAVLIGIGALYLSAAVALRARVNSFRRIRLPFYVAAILLVAFLIAIGALAIWPDEILLYVMLWEHAGTVTTTDLDGHSCMAEVFSKPTSLMNPPGFNPRIRVVSRCEAGSASFIHQTNWRWWVELPNVIPGGVEFDHPKRKFELKGLVWSQVP